MSRPAPLPRASHPTSLRARRRAGAALVAAAAVVTLAACSSSSPEAGAGGATTGSPAAAAGPRTAYPLTLDNCGYEVTVEHAPDRVVTIKSTTTEMLLSLGLGQHVVGTAFQDGPLPDSLAAAAAGNAAIAKPLSDKLPSSEAVLATQPDLVYAGWESNVSKTGVGERSTLTSLGVASYVSPSACQEPAHQPDPLTFDDVFGEIQEVGKIFDVQGAADALVARQKADLASIAPDTRGLSALWWSSSTDIPYVGAGIGAPEMIMKAVGLDNIAAGEHATWAPFSWEKVIAADPDVIVVVDAAWNTAQHKIDYLESTPATKNLTAVKNHRFLVVPFAATEAGVRNVEAAKDLAADLAKVTVP